MAKGAYIGVGDVAKKVKGGYVGVDGIARKIIKAYVGVDGIARLCWSSSGATLAFGRISKQEDVTTCTITNLGFTPNKLIVFMVRDATTGLYPYYYTETSNNVSISGDSVNLLNLTKNKEYYRYYAWQESDDVIVGTKTITKASSTISISDLSITPKHCIIYRQGDEVDGFYENYTGSAFSDSGFGHLVNCTYDEDNSIYYASYDLRHYTTTSINGNQVTFTATSGANKFITGTYDYIMWG